MGTVTFVKDLEDFTGDARLYKCDPPMVIHGRYDEPDGETEYVIASATIAFDTGPETYLFPANSDGEVTGWSELEGSYKGGMNHGKALGGAGYTVK